MADDFRPMTRIAIENYPAEEKGRAGQLVYQHARLLERLGEPAQHIMTWSALDREVYSERGGFNIRTVIARYAKMLRRQAREAGVEQ